MRVKSKPPQVKIGDGIREKGSFVHKNIKLS